MVRGTAGFLQNERAFGRGELKSQFWDNAHTVAAGLRVPKPLGDAFIKLVKMLIARGAAAFKPSYVVANVPGTLP